MKALIRPLKLILIVWLGLLLCAASVSGEPEPSRDLKLDDLNHFLGTLDQDIQELLPKLDPAAWKSTGPWWDWGKVGRGMGGYFLREIVFNLRLLAELMLLALALAILQNIHHAFEGETVSRMAFGFCFLVAMGIILNSFRVTFAVAKGAVDEMSNFMYAIVPLLFSLIVAGGGVNSATMVHPLLISSVELVGSLVKGVVFPLIVFGGVLGLVSFLAEGFEVNKLAGIFRNVALGILGVTMTAFIGLITIKGFAGGVADSTALRTAKYMTNTFLPVVGSELADTMEMAVGSSLILKSGIGIFGLGLVVLITVFPLIKILAVAAIYQLTSAIMQPLGNHRLADALQTVGGIIMNIFGVVAVVGLMFYIAIAVLVGMAGIRSGW